MEERRTDKKISNCFLHFFNEFQKMEVDEMNISMFKREMEETKKAALEKRHAELDVMESETMKILRRVYDKTLELSKAICPYVQTFHFQSNDVMAHVTIDEDKAVFTLYEGSLVVHFENKAADQTPRADFLSVSNEPMDGVDDQYLLIKAAELFLDSNTDAIMESALDACEKIFSTVKRSAEDTHYLDC